MTILEFLDRHAYGVGLVLLFLVIWGIPNIIRAFKGQDSDF